jgi:hypothetical protein
VESSAVMTGLPCTDEAFRVGLMHRGVPFQVEEVARHGWTHQSDKKADDNEETDEEAFVM